MRRCGACGEPIPAHTYEPLHPMNVARIQSVSRDAQDARRKVRAMSRHCPLKLHRFEADGMLVYRADRAS